MLFAVERKENRMGGGVVPWFRREFFQPLYFARNGSRRLKYWQELEETQYWPESRLLELQWQRLKELFSFVYSSNDFYRDRFESAGLRPEDIQSSEDLRRLPILTKEEMRRASHSFISNGYQKEGLLCFKTGGSTGKSLELFITEECSELRNACARRHDRWAGWEPGEAIGALWGNPKRPVSLKERFLDRFVQPVVYLDTMKFTDASVLRFATEWRVAKPTLLFGHAHSLFLLANFVRKLGIKSICPTAILSTSMMLLPHERELIEEVFGIKVFDRYGCEEVSLIGAECECHQGFHLNIEHLFIEFVREDGNPVVSGEPGRIIVTDLMNRAMPFIRYQVEDVGIPSARRCFCGRGLPLMESVCGRLADFLITRSGTRVAGVSLIENTLTRIPGIAQMQIIQESLQNLVLKVVQAEDCPEASLRDLADYFRGIFEGTRIDIHLVDEILPEKSGKYRFSICKITG